MPFKEAQRMIYKKNPLDQVVCQLRFPCILSINEKPPATFQDCLRDQYPFYNVTTENVRRVLFEPDSDGLPFNISPDNLNNYSFTSDDGVWVINLTSTFLSLTTTNYLKWEDFIARLRKILAVLIEIYKPVFFERVGLRYIDVFCPSRLGLKDVAWDELIQPFVLGFLSCNDVKNDVTGYSGTSELDIGNGAIARIITALGYAKNSDKQPITNSELSFIVDSDLFFGKKYTHETEDAIEELHRHSTKIIRAIITDKLHHAMEPESK
ncbi:MAG: TIGR04255 family protein [Planctomycetaceae bacterium]|jgi:uncharacterized protein (TIGR04255 family)|nr:TIGR04255 family protein [Planctomycetaceae bacterium]